MFHATDFAVKLRSRFPEISARAFSRSSRFHLRGIPARLIYRSPRVSFHAFSFCLPFSLLQRLNKQLKCILVSVPVLFITIRMGDAPIIDKMHEARLCWYGHVIQSGNDTVAKTAYHLSPPGRCPCGRPKKQWLDHLVEDMRAPEITLDDALDSVKWRKARRQADPAPSRDTRCVNKTLMKMACEEQHVETPLPLELAKDTAEHKTEYSSTYKLDILVRSVGSSAIMDAGGGKLSQQAKQSCRIAKQGSYEKTDDHTLGPPVCRCHTV
ncbi:hypothetical protein QTP86_002345 [Hemibagrus guttatus]|nr:hypothetical protein QTP86_002345 [Hemibagrus guttatus]